MEWEGWQQLDVAPPVRPRRGDVMIATTEQFDAWLRGRGITDLLYTGFCTNLCILDAPGGMRLMAPLGYRCVILREATLAVEFPDTLERRLQTQASLRYIEGWVGYTPLHASFEEGPVGAEICEHAVRRSRELGAWGTLVCSNAAPHHPMWNDVALQRRLNDEFRENR